MTTFYKDGEPVEIDGRWHIRWTHWSGEAHVTPYSYPDRQMAEHHINTNNTTPVYPEQEERNT